MASSTPQTPPQPSAAPRQPQVDQYNNTNPFVHNVALGVTPIALFALFLPPRRMDVRALILGGVALWGTNQLVHDYTGSSTMHRLGRRVSRVFGNELPDKAKETQLRLRIERAHRARKLQELQEAGLPAEQRKLIEEQQRQQQERQMEERGLLQRVWMGDSPDDWKEKRDQREKEALSEGGEGYWGLIVDQISEVFNGGKKKDDAGKTKEEADTEGESKKS